MLDFIKIGRKKINYLELTPYRLCEFEKNENGIITLLVPRFPNKLLGKLLNSITKRPYIRANLDDLGSAAWINIDGEKNVEIIGRILRETYGEKVEPVYDRLTNFFTQLYRSGLISFKELKKGKYYG